MKFNLLLHVETTAMPPPPPPQASLSPQGLLPRLSLGAFLYCTSRETERQSGSMVGVRTIMMSAPSDLPRLSFGTQWRERRAKFKLIKLAREHDMWRLHECFRAWRTEIDFEATRMKVYRMRRTIDTNVKRAVLMAWMRQGERYFWHNVVLNYSGPPGTSPARWVTQRVRVRIPRM